MSARDVGRFGMITSGQRGREPGRMSTPMDAPHLPSRLAFLCLLAQLIALPLMPAEGSVAVAKHVVFLGLGVTGLLCVAVDALRGKAIPALGTPTDLGVLLFLATALPAAAKAARYSARTSPGCRTDLTVSR